MNKIKTKIRMLVTQKIKSVKKSNKKEKEQIFSIKFLEITNEVIKGETIKVINLIINFGIRIKYELLFIIKI